MTFTAFNIQRKIVSTFAYFAGILFFIGLTIALQAQITTFSSIGDNQTYTVTSSDVYTITVKGGGGGGNAGGSAATITADFNLQTGNVLTIVAGESGVSGESGAGELTSILPWRSYELI